MKALVIGAARSGVAVTRLLHQHHYDVVLCSNEDFKERPELEALGVRVVLDDKDMSLVDNYDVVIKNPGIPSTHPLVQAFTHVRNEIDLAYQWAPHFRYYAVSGTNGKTTTTSLLGVMLKAKDPCNALAGNIGIPLSELVYQRGDEAIDVALEIAAFQMEGTPHFAPAVYALLNLSPDHLDRYKDAQEYYQAKTLILDRVGCLVRNADDENVMAMTQHYQGECIDVSLIRQDTDVYYKDEAIYYHDKLLFHEQDLRLPGKHNLFNAAVAAIMAYLAGLSPALIQESLRNFSGVEHRIEYITDIKGVKFYNDSKATNPESSYVCLKAFKQPIILLAGGYDKKISFLLLREVKDKVKKAYLFGASAIQLRDEVFPDAMILDNLEDATKAAYEESEAGDIIVLSPACASYDQFHDYEERGKIFKEIVKNLS